MTIISQGQDFGPGTPIPKRVTQLTIQQVEVLWVGTWKTQEEILAAEAQNTAQTSPEAVATTQEADSLATPLEYSDIHLCESQILQWNFNMEIYIIIEPTSCLFLFSNAADFLSSFLGL